MTGDAQNLVAKVVETSLCLSGSGSRERRNVGAQLPPSPLFIQSGNLAHGMALPTSKLSLV